MAVLREKLQTQILCIGKHWKGSKINEYVICRLEAFFKISKTSVKIKKRIYILVLDNWEKDCLPWLMFNNFTKLTKILYLNERKFNAAGFILLTKEKFRAAGFVWFQ